MIFQATRALITLMLVAGFASPACAQWFVDLYAGGAATQTDDFAVRAELRGISTSVRAADVEYDPSVSGGVRLGRWSQFFGLGVDLSYFQANISGQTATVAGVPFTLGENDIGLFYTSLDLMGRVRLLSDHEMPDGRLDVYGYIGPAFGLAHFEPANADESSVDVFGVKAGAGVTWLLTKNVGLFGEYRFTHFSPEFEYVHILSGARVTYEPTLNTHHLFIGVSFRF